MYFGIYYNLKFSLRCPYIKLLNEIHKTKQRSAQRSAQRVSQQNLLKN